MFLNFGRREVVDVPIKNEYDISKSSDPEIQRQWISYRRALRPFNATPFIVFSSAAIPTFFIGWTLSELYCMNENMSDTFHRSRNIFYFLSMVRLIPAWIFAYVVYFNHEERVNCYLQKVCGLMGLSRIKEFVSLDGVVLILAMFAMGSIHILKSVGAECVESSSSSYNVLCSRGISNHALPYDSYGVILMLPLMLQVFYKGSCFAVILIAWFIMSISVLLSLYIVGERNIFTWLQQCFLLFNVYSLITQNENFLQNCFKMKLDQESLIRSSLAAEHEKAMMDMQATEIR